jgi:deoxyadenosine/deoxycytidine kinase
MPIFSVEGSIGAGKTTFLKSLEDSGYKVLYEPVDDWTSKKSSGMSMLEHYYSDKQKYGFAFQMYVFQSRIQHLLKLVETNPNAIIITERCYLTDKNIFAEMMYEQNILNQYEYDVYNEWYMFISKLVPKIDGIIYLQVKPGICIERIIKRNRKGESSIDLNYINCLNEKHESWLNSYDNPICIVDGNGSVPTVDQVNYFINRTVMSLKES